MKGQEEIIKFVLITICFFAVACSGTRHLPEGEKLYTGAQIKLQSFEKIKNKKAITAAAQKAVRPRQPHISRRCQEPGVCL